MFTGALSLWLATIPDPSIQSDPRSTAYTGPTPAILYLEMEGIEIAEHCLDGPPSVQGCIDQLAEDVAVPPYGFAPDRALLLAEAQALFEPFAVTVTDQRPPAYLPYTMITVGGRSADLGFDPGICGLAWRGGCLASDRDHVGFAFVSEECPQISNQLGFVAGVTWGLDISDYPLDAMFGSASEQVRTFVDACVPADSCSDSNCPEGQQNSFAALTTVFGPRVEDTINPEIVDLLPSDGSVFEPTDTIEVGAWIDEDSPLVGVRWSWIEGLPPDVDAYERCTNNACQFGYDHDAGIGPGPAYWDFVTLDGAPIGTYAFRLEASDASGNTIEETIRIEVRAANSSDSNGDSDGDDPSADEAGSTGESQPAPEESSGDEHSEGGASSGGDEPAQDSASGSGGGCSLVSPGHESYWALLWFGIVWRRRSA